MNESGGPTLTCRTEHEVTKEPIVAFELLDANGEIASIPIDDAGTLATRVSESCKDGKRYTLSCVDGSLDIKEINSLNFGVAPGVIGCVDETRICHSGNDLEVGLYNANTRFNNKIPLEKAYSVKPISFSETCEQVALPLP